MMGTDPATIGILVTITTVGVLLTVAGYDLTDTILSVVGWVAGGATGGAIGWIGIPRIVANGGFETPQLLAITGVLVIFGALLGAGLIRLFTQFATGIAGFSVGVAATFFTLAGERLSTSADEVATATLENSPIAAINLFQFSTLPQDVLIQTLGIGAIVGIVTGVLAMRNYDILMSVCLTGLGAALIANTTPIWSKMLQENPTSLAQAEFSPLIAAATFAIGLSVQYIRHRETDTSDPLEDYSEE